jgi:serine phosphatase RsbU (regulator of sigma subunit)
MGMVLTFLVRASGEDCRRWGAVPGSELHIDRNAQPRQVWLVGIETATRNMRLRVDGPILVGRGSYNHLVLDDSRLSRQHSRIAPEREGCVVYDLNSVNGTFVNGVAVTRHVLAADDVVSFGPFSFRVEHAPLGAAGEPAPRAFEEPTLSSAGASSRPPSENLGTLYSFMQAISKTIDRRELLQLIGAKLLEVYPAARYVGIHLRRTGPHGHGELELARHVGVLPAGVAPALPSDMRRPVFDRRRANMYAPLVDRDVALGVIHVSGAESATDEAPVTATEERPPSAEPDGAGAFSRADLDLLAGMSTAAAIMLQNSRMHEETLVQARLRHDLALAAQIQKSFLPREVIAVEGLDLFAEYRAAYTVGGDFYDVFWVEPRRLAVFIGDISGKGISGALLMARISTELRVAGLAHVDPVTVLMAMNKATISRGPPELFFTAVYFTLDVKTGDVLLVNAGHPIPYRRRADGHVHPITAGRGCAVGILDDPGFTATSLRLACGDTLVLYTDGVIEAANAEGALYGQQRLEACLARAGTPGRPGAAPRPNLLAEDILRSVEQFAAQGPVSDDLTLLICQRSAGTAPTMQPRRRSSSFPAPTVPKPPSRR